MRGVAAAGSFLLLVLILSGSASAQFSNENVFVGGQVLKVQVIGENNWPIKTHLRVQLQNFRGEVVAESNTNPEGWAFFNRVTPGEYRVAVSGEGIEDTRSPTFTVYPRVKMTSEFVRVSLRQAGDAVGPQSSVAAENLVAPPAAKKQYEKGVEAFGRSDWPAAEKHFRQATEIYPSYALAFSALGVVHLHRGDREQARRALEQAITISDHSLDAYVNLGRVALAEGKFAEAETLLQRSLVLDPANVNALTLIAHAQLAAGKLDEALANARKVHALPHSGYAAWSHYLAARVLEAQKRAPEATEEYELFLKEAPADPNAERVRAALAQQQRPKN